MPADTRESEVDDSDFPRERAKFYELIGHCITLYQGLEDYLPKVFAAAIGGPADRAYAIFAPYRGLEAKLEGITAAVSGGDQGSRDRWERLRPLIRAASETRGKIAHASVLHRGGGHTITLDEETNVVSVRRTAKSRMELRKSQKGSELVWDNDKLFEEYGRIERARELSIGLVRRLTGQSVPPHLDDDPPASL